ncbi:hypothetical protein HZA26_03995 [Candidatus Nomurabacteria bacterium]|nr:hypothetical protein [Candidatus Nomurabacteria bacterium]
MSKTLMSVLILGFVGMVGYFVFIRDKGVDPKLVDENTETRDEATSKKMAFTEFLKQGGSYKCEVNQYVDSVETKGTTYISGGMIRGEYNTKVQGVDMASTMIIRDGYTYSWTSMLPNSGFKIKNEVSSDAGGSMSGVYGYGEQIGDYNCEVWAADPSKFAIPKNVSFQEITPK